MVLMLMLLIQHTERRLFITCVKKSTHYETVVMLLENDTALERTDSSGATPLYLACYSLNDHIVQLLDKD